MVRRNTGAEKHIKKFHEEYPGVNFELYEGNTFQLIEKLKTGTIEIAIVRSPFHEDGFNCVYLEEEPMVAVGIKEMFQKTRVVYEGKNIETNIVGLSEKDVIDVYHVAAVSNSSNNPSRIPSMYVDTLLYGFCESTFSSLLYILNKWYFVVFVGS